MSLVFAELFKTSFLIDPTGIKLSRFSSKSGYSTIIELSAVHASPSPIVMFVVFKVIFLQVQLILIAFFWKQRSWHTLLLGAERSSCLTAGGLITSSKWNYTEPSVLFLDLG